MPYLLACLSCSLAFVLFVRGFSFAAFLQHSFFLYFIIIISVSCFFFFSLSYSIHFFCILLSSYLFLVSLFSLSFRHSNTTCHIQFVTDGCFHQTWGQLRSFLCYKVLRQALQTRRRHLWTDRDCLWTTFYEPGECLPRQRFQAGRSQVRDGARYGRERDIRTP